MCLQRYTFTCAKCGKHKHVRGRVKHKDTGRKDGNGRIVYNFKCAECAKGESK